MEKRAREQEAVGDERVENNHLSSFSTDDDDSHHCSYHCDCDCDCEGESPSSIIKLDDNGFPPSQLSSGLQDYEGSLPTSSELHTYRSFPTGETEATAAASSFASDFYGCGTDWSSLLLPFSHNENDNQKNNNDDPKATPRRLKQTNLFQMWGVNIKVPDPNTSEANHDGPSSSSSSLHHHHHPIKKPKALFSAGSSSNPRLNSNSTTTTTNNNNNNNAFIHLLRSNTSTGAKSKSTGGITSGRATLTNNTGGVANKQRPRVCPFYKKIPGTPFTVDAFCYGRIEGCNAYILSHFHADHYGGLSKGWSHGPIYCTPLTARLVRLCLYVNPIFIHSLELGTEYIIEGIKVTMLEANHCPGAALIHFCLPNGQRYLHTGDFRASKLMHTYSLLVKQQVNVLYLDTTYCNPKYRFPSKEDVLSFVVKVTRNFLNKHPKTLIIVGAYSIGKECVYLAISKALGVKIHANSSRRRILQSFGWPELSGNLCPNGNETPLHVLPISSLRFEVLDHYSKTYRNQYTAVLAFRPTGWTYSEAIGSYLDLIKPSSRGIVTIYGVPYSEHSNFTELREFVQFIKPDKIIPTVNVGNAANRDKMQSYFREWLKG